MPCSGRRQGRAESARGFLCHQSGEAGAAHRRHHMASASSLVLEERRGKRQPGSQPPLARPCLVTPPLELWLGQEGWVRDNGNACFAGFPIQSVGHGPGSHATAPSALRRGQSTRAVKDLGPAEPCHWGAGGLLHSYPGATPHVDSSTAIEGP